MDAPVHVAHAFSTHSLDTEVDFFTVVDDLAGDETGAAHANDMELGAGFYGYVVIDIPLLLSNLTGCDRNQWKEQDFEVARSLLELLIHAIAEVTWVQNLAQQPLMLKLNVWFLKLVRLNLAVWQMLS